MGEIFKSDFPKTSFYMQTTDSYNGKPANANLFTFCL